MKTTLRQLGERGLIALLKRQLPRGRDVRIGIGDDCAAVQIGRGAGDRLLLLKTDAVVEGVHFDQRATPFQIGWKAMARPLSDFAAMAGRPRWALVTATLREEMPVRFVREVYRGLAAAAGKFGVTIVGGETVRTPDRFWLSVALAGEVEPQAMKLRSAARPNDAIYVTGALGGSIAGKHLKFTPRIAEAQWLAKQGCVGAMIDISDGLARDLGHICRESGISAVVWKSAVPIALAAGRSLQRALHDGEDFELLFTVPSERSKKLERAWRKKFPRLRLSLLGFTTCGEGIRLLDHRGRMRPLDEDGYDHFQPRHA
ncbi:MAG: thiamine-monophosphate kinase [Verrucomicrobia bacterium]|nr:thiamine-monophosphate kinase [Verrucomicrobiota bacterium]